VKVYDKIRVDDKSHSCKDSFILDRVNSTGTEMQYLKVQKKMVKIDAVRFDFRIR